MLKELKAQLYRLFPTLLLVYIPVFAVLFGLFLLWLLTEARIADLTRDPLAVVETALLAIQRQPVEGIHILAELNIPLYAGLISNLGVLLWCGAGAICLFTWALLRRMGAPGPRGAYLCAGLLSILLMLDDLFLLHERVLPMYFGPAEKALFAVYGVLALAYVLGYRQFLMRTDWLLLVAAFVLFTVSLGFDFVSEETHIPQRHFFEDGSKFAGIATWTAYHVRTAAIQLLALARDVET